MILTFLKKMILIEISFVRTKSVRTNETGQEIDKEKIKRRWEKKY